MKTRHLFVVGLFAMTTACAGSSPTSPTITNSASIAQSTSTGDQISVVAGPFQQLRGPKQQRITKGQMSTASSIMTGALTLSGPRFDFVSEWTDGGSTGCQPCLSGASPIWTSAAFTGSAASAVVDGVRYDRVYVSGSIQVSGTVKVPAVDTPVFTVNFPFTIDNSSLLIGYRTNPLAGPAEELFRINLTGSGTGTIELSTVHMPDSSIVYTSRSIVYAF